MDGYDEDDLSKNNDWSAGEEIPCHLEAFHRDVSYHLESYRLEMILEGGDIQLVGIATDGRIFVQLNGPVAKVCREKREALLFIEKSLKERVPRITRVISVCPVLPEEEAR